MFCRLYELKIGTGIDILYDYDICSSECPSCRDDDECTISDDHDKHLDKDKFGWRISTRISLPTPTNAKTGGLFTNFIQLIHPVNSDVWIAKSLKKDNETVMYCVFYEGTQRENFRSMEALNKVANGKYFKGRDLKESDFGGLHVQDS